MKPRSKPQQDRASSRRSFLGWMGAGAASLACASQTGLSPASAAQKAAPVKKSKLPFELGIASYTFRKFDLDKTLAMTKRVGLKQVCLKSFHLPLEATPEQCAAAAEKVKKAGMTLYGGGVITMQKEAQVNQAFDYAKAAGMTTIIGAPTAEMLPLVNAKIKQYGIAVAIHNHGPGDKHFPTPQSVYEKIKDFDKRFGLCIDIGHTVRIGADLIESTLQFGDRLLDVHIKDVTAADPKGQGIQVGRGIIDIPAFLRALVKINYRGVVAYEYEEEENDPLPGLAESVGYTRGVMAML